ncbi:hypothetical protein P7C70_g6253, partial [Phenoliferia sp. Uapishka_3]
VRVLGTFSGLVNMVIFMLMMNFLVALMAAQMFRGLIPYDPSGDAMNYYQIFNSFLAMYQLLSSENWTTPLETVLTNEVGQVQIVIAAAFLAGWMLFAYFILINMFIAVINENFAIAEEEKHQQQLKAYEDRNNIEVTEPGWFQKINPYSYLKPKENVPLGTPSNLGLEVPGKKEEDALREKISKASSSPPRTPLKTRLVNTLRRGKKGENHALVDLNSPSSPGQEYMGDLFPVVETAAKDESLAALEHRRAQQADFIASHPSYDRSLWIFSNRNWIRRFCQRLVAPGHGGERIYGRKPVRREKLAFRALLFAAIVGSVAIAGVATPLYRRNYFLQHGEVRWTWFNVTEISLGLLFVVEFLIKVIADGFVFSPNAYILSVWNALDFFVLVTLIINVVTALVSPSGISRFTRALKAFRALRLVGLSPQIRRTFYNVLIVGAGRILDASLLAILYIIPFAVWGLNIFNGRLYFCNDSSVATKAECAGEFLTTVTSISDASSNVTDNWNYLAPRIWTNPYVWTFDTFRGSLLILFEIISLEGWVSVMESVMQITGLDRQPQLEASQWNALFLVIYNLIGAVFILTLFVSVIIENFTRRSGTSLLTTEQRQWIDLRKLILRQRPAKRPKVVPTSTFRHWCFDRANSKKGWWSRCMTVLYCLQVVTLMTQAETNAAGADDIRSPQSRIIADLMSNLILGAVVENFSYVFQIYGKVRSINREQMRGYKRVWQRFDPERTEFMPRRRIVPFLASLNNVFEVRIYPADRQLKALWDATIVGPDDGDPGTKATSKRRFPAGRSVDLRRLAQVLNETDVAEVQKRRLRYKRIFHEAMMEAEANPKGISFRSMLLLLAHHCLIQDDNALQLEESLVRAEKLRKVQDRIDADHVRSLFKATFQRRNFLAIQEERRQETAGVPAIVVDDGSAPEIIVDAAAPAPRGPRGGLRINLSNVSTPPRSPVGSPTTSRWNLSPIEPLSDDDDDPYPFDHTFGSSRDRSTLETLSSTLRTWRAPSSAAVSPPPNATASLPSPPPTYSKPLFHSPGLLLTADFDESSDVHTQGAFVLNIPSLDSALGSFTSGYPKGVGVIAGAIILPPPVINTEFEDTWSEQRPLVAILARQEASSHVLLYSLRSHRVVHDFPVAGVGHRIQANNRHVVVSTSAPLAIHIFSAISFHPTPFSPLYDVAPSPFDGAPVFSLGKGGRILAYATDRSVSSSRHDTESARPGAGTVSQRGMFDSDQDHSPDAYRDASSGSGGFMGDARAAGQVGGEVARRVGEGVLSGVKAIGDIGLSYWLSKNPSGEGNSGAGGGAPVGSGRTFSKSAPNPSFRGFESRSPPQRTSARLASESTAAGTVAVVDLLSPKAYASSATKSNRRKPSREAAPSLKLLAHFRPYTHPISLISLAPSSSLVLTSSSQGHSFDIFELKPAVAVGTSATNEDHAVVGKAWHRYRLTRGFTTAEATTASWSSDLRFISVGTGKGTTRRAPLFSRAALSEAHNFFCSDIYATQPFGGKADLRSHLAPKVSNALELQPLSVTLSTITRIRRSRLETSELDSLSSFIPPCLSFISKSDSHASSFRHTPVTKAPSIPPVNTRSPKSPGLSLTTPAPSLSAIQDCLLFYPQSGTCILDRLSAAPTPAIIDGSLDVGRLATTAVSGLSQLMKNRGHTSPTTASEPDWVVSCSGKAEWLIARQSGWDDVREELIDDSMEAPLAGRSASRFSAEAEIETFSRSPRVLPRSIYQSPQFDFFALPQNHLERTEGGHFALNLRRLEMRSEVQIWQGGENVSDEHNPASFDQPIKSAMQTILDSEAALVSASPKTLTPTFPNGVAGKQGRWRDAIPIRSMAPSVNESIGRVRKELGRVRVSAMVPRRRASSSGGYGTAGETYSSSISFEDNDAVFADRMHSESGSTACTSEPDAESDDASWGLDGLEEEPVDMDVGLIDEEPFEDDFDDFSATTFTLEHTTSVRPVVSSKEPRMSLPVPIPSNVDKLFQACTSLGFFYLKNHGVDPEPVFEMGQDTFALPMEELMKFEQGDTGMSAGYKRAGLNNVDAAGNVDTVHFINLAKDDVLHFPEVRQRTYPQTCVQKMDDIYKFVDRSDEVLLRLMVSLEPSLGLPPGTFAGLHPRDRNSGSECRIISKPAAGETNHVPEGDGGKAAAIGSHTGKSRGVFQQDVA